MVNSQMFEGFVIFVLVNKGSKSEHFAPVLIIENGETIWLYKEEDNPFMYESIRDYHLSYCQLKGILDHKKNQIIISDIKKIVDPVIRLWKDSGSRSETEVSTDNKKETDE